MKISEITRRDIIDEIAAQGIKWSGRLEECEFLSRLYDLSSLPSTDPRFSDATGDILQHRVKNPRDWDDNWVFYDPRFNLINGDDEIFLNFLCESIHPIVRQDVWDIERICGLYNSFLINDGFQLIETTRISGKPIYSGRHTGIIDVPGIAAARESLNWADGTYVAQQITRMESAVIEDPSLAIGTAKELIETCCKTILNERGVPFEEKKLDFPQLVRLTFKNLKLTRDDIDSEAKASKTIKNILSSLGTISDSIAELRSDYGTGHGKTANTKGLSSRHAKLAVGAAATLAVFLVETHYERSK